MTLLLADISARLKLKDSRASFVGTRAEDKKIKLTNITDGVCQACEDPLRSLDASNQRVLSLLHGTHSSVYPEAQADLELPLVAAKK